MQPPKTHPRIIREFYFWAGIIATFAYRIIVVLNNYSAIWVSVAWYVGTIGFILYFMHRYSISNLRAKLIEKNQLIKKIDERSELNEDDRAALGYILRTLKTTKEKWNSIFIFVASGIALLVGVYLDFFS
ncbi:MAG: hypothetical protein WCV86_00730 [Patescibacteria group bacterium]